MLGKLKKKLRASDQIDLNGIIFFAFDLFRKNAARLFFGRFNRIRCRLKGVKLGKNVSFNGKPIINRYPNSSIIIGDNTKLNSSKYSMSIGLQQPCAFATLGEGSKITMGINCGASGLKIHAKSSISIGNNVLFGAGCTIIDNDAHHSNMNKRAQNIIPSRPVTIGDNAFIGMQCIILKGVPVGENAIIAAGSVVYSNIPRNAIAGGNPCKVIMIRSEKTNPNSPEKTN